MRKLGLILFAAHLPLHVFLPVADLIGHAGIALFLLPSVRNVFGNPQPQHGSQ